MTDVVYLTDKKVIQAIKENTETLMHHYKLGEISKYDILEMEQEAVREEEYEIAVSLKEVLDYIKQ